MTTMRNIHLGEELAQSSQRVIVETRFGEVIGGRSTNGAAVFLGESAFRQTHSLADTIQQKYLMR